MQKRVQAASKNLEDRLADVETREHGVAAEEETLRAREEKMGGQETELKEKLADLAKTAAGVERREALLEKGEERLKLFESTLEKRNVESNKLVQGIERRGGELDRAEKDLNAAKGRIEEQSRQVAHERPLVLAARVDLARKTKELESQAAAVTKREAEAADRKSKAMSLLKYAEKAAAAKERELKERMDETAAAIEAQRVETTKAAKAQEDLDERERRFETVKAEFDARAKALEQREKRLREEAAALVREQSEVNTLWKNLGTEGERIARKEKEVDSAVSRGISKEREALDEQTQKVRGMTTVLKNKEKSAERERVRLEALSRELQALKSGLEARDRALKEQEAQLARRREEVRRMRAQIEELL